MGKSLQELLAPRMFTGVYETVMKGVPKVLPDTFYLNPQARKIIGSNATYFKSTGIRDSAKTSSYGSPPSEVQGAAMVSVPVNLLHAIHEFRHNYAVLQGLINPENEQQQLVYLGEIDRQAMNFTERFATLRTNAVHSAFSTGKIWIGSDGSLNTSSSGAINTIDFGCTVKTASASWNTASTDIIKHIEEVKREQLMRGRAPIRYAIHGKNIPTYIAKNDVAKLYINNTPQLAVQAYQNTSTIPNGFAGLTWLPADAAFHVSGSTVTEWFDGDRITFLPELSSTWYETIEGSYSVPTNGMAIGSNPAAMASSPTTVFGMFGWCYQDHRYPSVVQVGGDTFLPVIRDGGAVTLFDAT